MKKIISLSLFVLCLIIILPFQIKAQVGINNDNNAPDPSAMLDIQSTEKGMLMPRMTVDQRDAIPNPTAGLMIYNLNDSCFNYFTGKKWIKDCGRTDWESPFSPASIGGTGSDFGFGISNDADGNSYVIGRFNLTATFGDFTLTSSGDEDVFVAKLDPYGEVIWAHQLGSSDTDYGYGISTDASGNSYITGSFSGSVSFGSTTLISNGLSDIFVAKLGSDGQFLWAISAGGNNGDTGYGVSFDAAGNSYVTGSFWLTATFGNITLTSSYESMFIMKVDPSGQILWASEAGGGNYRCRGRGLSIDEAGNSYVTGNFKGSVTFGSTTLTSNGIEDIFVSKIDPNGLILWAINIGGTLSDFGRAISNDAAGNVYVTGRFYGNVLFGSTTLSSYGNYDVFVTKINPSGQIQWAINAGAGSNDEGNGIATDAAGNSYVTGTFRGTATFGSSSLSTFGDNDIFVTKINPLGLVEWARHAGGTAYDTGLAISGDYSGYIMVTGFFRGTATFGEHTMTSKGNNDVFVWMVNRTDGLSVEPRLTDLQDWDWEWDHIATQNIQLDTFFLSGDGDDEGIFVASNGRVGIGTDNPVQQLEVLGNIQATGNNSRLVFNSRETDNAGTSYERRSEIRTNLDAPSGIGTGAAEPEKQWMTFHVSTDAGTGTKQVMSLQGDGTVGIGNISGKSASTTLHVEETEPVIRLVDDRNQASGSGNVFGSLEWYTRDASFGGVDFNEVGSIEVINVNGTATPDTRMEFAVWNNDATGTYEIKPFSLWPNGNISMGDGTIEPTKAKLEIIGSGSSYTVSGQSRYYGSGGVNSNNNYSGPFSIYADGIVGGGAFVAHSDARIKHIYGLSDSQTDLTTLMKIEVTDYKLRDTIAKGHIPYKKVIAQQVAEVYPQAVTNNLTEVIPDIYQRAEVKEGWIMLATSLKEGDRVKLITEESSKVYDVMEVKEKQFRVATETLPSQVFVYGREVDDFHTVDYEAISMLNVSATQEQQKIIEELMKKNNELESRLQALEIFLTKNFNESSTRK